FTWVVRTKDCLERTKRTTSPYLAEAETLLGLFFVLSFINGFFLGFYFVQDAFDLHGVVDRLVQPEVDFGSIPQLKPAADLAAKETLGPLQGLHGFGAGFLVPQDGDENI